MRLIRILDYTIYIAIGFIVVLTAVFHDRIHGWKWIYLGFGTVAAWGLILSLLQDDQKNSRFWKAALTILALETAALAILFRSSFVDGVFANEGGANLVLFGIVTGEVLLNTLVLRALQPPPI